MTVYQFFKRLLPHETCKLCNGWVCHKTREWPSARGYCFSMSVESLPNAIFDMSKYKLSRSVPIARYPRDSAAARVEPLPAKGSHTIPIPSGREALTIWRRNFCGFRDGCGAISRSSGLVGGQVITSFNCSVEETCLSPPVPQALRLIAMVP